MDDELSLDELEQVGTPGFMELNDFMTAFEQGDFQRAIDLGQRLLSNPMFDEEQLAEISKMITQAKSVLNNDKTEANRFGL